MDAILDSLDEIITNNLTKIIWVVIGCIAALIIEWMFITKPSFNSNTQILFSNTEIGNSNYSPDDVLGTVNTNKFVKILPSIQAKDKSKKNKEHTLVIRFENVNNKEVNITYLGNENIKRKAKKDYVEYKVDVLSSHDGKNQGDFLFKINSSKEKDIRIICTVKGRVNNNTYEQVLSFK